MQTFHIVRFVEWFWSLFDRGQNFLMSSWVV
jgi:hypothetical protein